jgi:hypothetical protein
MAPLERLADDNKPRSRLKIYWAASNREKGAGLTSACGNPLSHLTRGNPE